MPNHPLDNEAAVGNWDAVMAWDRGWRERCAKAEAEVERLQDAVAMLAEPRRWSEEVERLREALRRIMDSDSAAHSRVVAAEALDG